MLGGSFFTNLGSPQLYYFATLLHAYLLISCPNLTAESNPLLLNQVKLIAVQLELLDWREGGYTFTKLEDFKHDLSSLQDRYRDLKDVPPVVFANSLPPKNICQQLYVINCEYQRYLRQEIDSPFTLNKDLLIEALRKTERLGQTFVEARDIGSDIYYIHLRRKSLKTLINLVGEENLSRGILPNPIPLEYVPIKEFPERVFTNRVKEIKQHK
jgi:hypothetical protein